MNLEFYKDIQEEAFNWTFSLVDILNKITKPNGKIQDLQKSIEILKCKKNGMNETKARILQKLEHLDFNRKTVKNYSISLKKLLDCSIIDYSKSMRIAPKPFDIFEKIESSAINENELYRYILHINSKIEESFVAINQSYGRMLIKEKLSNS